MSAQLRINGKVVEAEEFAYDGCHKIYLVQNEEGRDNVEDYDLFPLSALPNKWKQSCGLRFISPADLHGPDLIGQFDDANRDDNAVTYGEEGASALVPARLSYYTSEDQDSPRWSVYSEWYTEESYAEGEPIDGSQKHLCSAVDEATADLIASALYATTTDNGIPVN